MDFTYRWHITILYVAELLAFYLFQDGFFFFWTPSKVRVSKIHLRNWQERHGAAKRKQKNYSEMLKDRCCRLSVMNILVRFSPLEPFNSVFPYKKRRETKKWKHKQLKNTFFSFFLNHGGPHQEFRNWLWLAALPFQWWLGDRLLPAPSPVLSRSKQCHPSTVIMPLPSSPWNDLSLINCILMSRST